RVEPEIVLGRCVGDPGCGQVAGCPGDAYCREAMALPLQVCQGAVIVALAIAHAVALTRIAQGWNQHDIGRRSRGTYGLLYAVEALLHGRTRCPQPELQRSVRTSDD